MPENEVALMDAPAAEAELRARLRECPDTRALADGAISPVAGGLSNRAWRLETQGAEWFVRLGHPGAEALGVDRASECRLLEAVAAAGLAPEVLACKPGIGLLVTRFVAGAPWSADNVALDENLTRVALALRRLHRMPVPDGVQTVSYSRQARRLAVGLPSDANDAPLHERAARLFSRLDDRGFAPATCHNDLHHLNLLDDGRRLWLVDWEYGGRGDPLMDLAGFIAMHELSPEATRTFLDAYGGLSAEDRALVGSARWAFDYVQWLWFRRRFPVGGVEDGGRTERLSRRLLHCDNRTLGREFG